MGRRDELVDAALLVVAEGGLKGLTHRAVDARAGLPSGSTANIFRDRRALVGALLEELERRDWGHLHVGAGGEESPEPRSADELARMLANGVATMVSPSQAPLARARLTMSLAYADEVRKGHVRLLEALARMLEASRISDPAGRARRVAAFLDGTLLHALTVAPGPLDRAAVTDAIRALLR